jgi:hypothetical protein
MGKPKAPKPPPPPPPVAPAATVEDTAPAGDEAITRKRRQGGYRKTVLTGSLSPSSGKKTVLG